MERLTLFSGCQEACLFLTDWPSWKKTLALELRLNWLYNNALEREDWPMCHDPSRASVKSSCATNPSFPHLMLLNGAGGLELSLGSAQTESMAKPISWM
jgi:hypothetical protein